MNINPIVASNSTTQARPLAHVQPTLHGDMKSGYLTTADIALIKAATNTEFNWPPGEGEGAPEAAFELAMLRHRQMLNGSALAELKATDLVALRRAGIINQEFLTNALDYLRSGDKGTDTTERTDLTRRDGHGPTIQSGTIAPDGSVYL